MTEMMKPSAYKPFILLMVMFTLQQACGGFAVVFYAVNVFQVTIESLLQLRFMPIVVIALKDFYLFK